MGAADQRNVMEHLRLNISYTYKWLRAESHRHEQWRSGTRNHTPRWAPGPKKGMLMHKEANQSAPSSLNRVN